MITLYDLPWEILKLKKDIYRLIRLLMNYWVMQKGKYFICNSPYTAKKLSRFYSKDYSIIPNSILLDWIINQPKKFPSENIKIVSLLSGWSKLKNPETALKAFSVIRKNYGNKVEYHLFGQDYEENGFDY